MFWYSLFRMLRVSKGNVDDFCNDLDCTHESLNADRPPLNRNWPIGYYELQVSWSLKRVTEPPENIYKGLCQWHRVSHAVNIPKRKAISSEERNNQCKQFLKEKKREGILIYAWKSWGSGQRLHLVCVSVQLTASVK